MAFIFITLVSGMMIAALFNMTRLIERLFPQPSVDTPSCSCESSESVTSPLDTQSPESESDYNDEDEDREPQVVFNYKSKVITSKTPCYMKDFYDESLMSPRWCTLTDKEKKFKLDKELDEYMDDK